VPTPLYRIRAATAADTIVILELIRGLAEFEKLAHEVVATEEQLRATLFGQKSAAEVLIAEVAVTANAPANARATELESGLWKSAGFALFFTSYSTFMAKPGIYLEDLFIRPEYRSSGLGRKLLAELARIAIERNSGRLEWSVLDWNKRALEFYSRLGATPMQEWTVHRLKGEELIRLAAEAKR
jgi:GNAT superfamily N-acetyltransferase